jgi:large subunit ribosomal protein L16
MGKGKGGIAYWIAPIKKGQIIFEINGVNLFKSISILRKALTKLPIKVSIVKVKY